MSLTGIWWELAFYGLVVVALALWGWAKIRDRRR